MELEQKKKVAYRLDQLVKHHLRINDQITAIAVWFKKNDAGKVHLMEGIISNRIDAIPSNLKPLILIHDRTAIGWELDLPLEHTIFYRPKEQLEEMLRKHDSMIADLTTDYEVLYFDPEYLSPEIMRIFAIKPEPDNLIKGWYFTAIEGQELSENRALIKIKENYTPTLGVMQTSESHDFKAKVGVMHVNVNKQWVPSTATGASMYNWYTETREGHPGYVLLSGGQLYKIDGFEIKTSSEISKRVIQRNKNDEYVEVHLSRI